MWMYRFEKIVFRIFKSSWLNLSAAIRLMAVNDKIVSSHGPQETIKEKKDSSINTTNHYTLYNLYSPYIDFNAHLHSWKNNGIGILGG